MAQTRVSVQTPEGFHQADLSPKAVKAMEKACVKHKKKSTLFLKEVVRNHGDLTEQTVLTHIEHLEAATSE